MPTHPRIQLNPMSTFPQDGKFYLVFDERKEPKALNQPPGYALGTWHKRRDKSWGGSSQASYFEPVGWCKIPKVSLQ